MSIYQHFSDSEITELLTPEPLPTGEVLLAHRLADVIRPCPTTILVFRGGGVLGAGYAGPLLEFEQHHTLEGIKTVAGSSAGGLAAILVAIGYTAVELKEMMLELEFHTLVKNPHSTLFQKFIDYCRGNLDSGALLQNKIEDYILKKLGTDDVIKKLGLTSKDDIKKITFRQLHSLGKRALYLTGTNTNFNKKTRLPKGEAFFSYEHTPDMSIAQAGRITASHPFAYLPYNYKGNWYTDGAVANPFPMAFFNHARFVPPGYHLSKKGKNLSVIGLLIDTEHNIKKLWAPLTPYTWAKWIMHILYEYVFRPLAFFGLYDRKHDHTKLEHHTRIIPIYDLDIDSLNFTVGRELKLKLIEGAQLETRRYLRTYNSFDSYLPNEALKGPAQYEYTSFKNFQGKYEKYDIENIQRILDYELTPAIKRYKEAKKTHNSLNLTVGLCIYKAEREAALKALEKLKTSYPQKKF